MLGSRLQFNNRCAINNYEYDKKFNRSSVTVEYFKTIAVLTIFRMTVKKETVNSSIYKIVYFTTCNYERWSEFCIYCINSSLNITSNAK